MTPGPLDGLRLDYVTFYVEDARTSAEELQRRYGLRELGRRDGDAERSYVLGSGTIELVLTEPVTLDNPVAAFLTRHGNGVADIAFSTPDVDLSYETALARGAEGLHGPEIHDGRLAAAIRAFGDVTHTLVDAGTARASDGSVGDGAPDDPGLHTVDHFAVCLEAEQLEPTVGFYHQVLDFTTIHREKIVVGDQGMNSEVVRNRSGDVTLTLIEPDVSRMPGQIDTFLKNHGGAGVQHLAFATDDIVRSVNLMRGRGVEFLTAPPAYYRHLTERLIPGRHPTQALAEGDILVDEDHDGQLFQIFTRSRHPSGTIFAEVVERNGATSFGSGNIHALYDAVRAADE